MPPLPSEDYRLAFPGVKNVYAGVRTADGPVKVYASEVYKDQRTAVAWIEAKEGQTFEVWETDLRKKKPDEGYSVEVDVDGDEVNGTFIPQNWSLYDKPLGDKIRVQTYWGAETSDTTERKFVFTKLRTTSDSQSSFDYADLLGSINVAYRRGKIVQSTGRKRVVEEEHDGRRVFEDEVFPGVNVQVDYGAEVKTKPRAHWTVWPLDPPDKPFSQVRFLYRSKEPTPSSTKNAPKLHKPAKRHRSLSPELAAAGPSQASASSSSSKHVRRKPSRSSSPSPHPPSRSASASPTAPTGKKPRPPSTSPTPAPAASSSSSSRTLKRRSSSPPSRRRAPSPSPAPSDDSIEILEDRLDDLKRDREIKGLEREIKRRRKERTREERVKGEEEEREKVKVEVKEEDGEKGKASGRADKGKGKGKEVLVLDLTGEGDE
ncbi:hypothetical protein JCM6882_002140 [Rhodosporidiobolus microsporus]